MSSMTIEELLDCTPEQLESFTDAQLLEWFKPFINITRPEYAPKPQARKEVFKQPPLDAKKQAALESLGIDMDFMNRKRKKK